MITRFLKGNEKNIVRDSFLWNTIAGGVNAAEAVVLMMVITRTNGLEAAGILSIAFAVGNLLMTIGKFGVRNFQVTDVSKEYSFTDYRVFRIVTCIAMLLISVGYIVIKYFTSGYSFEKAAVILGICLIYVVESFEDVYLGYYQEEGRLDIGSKIFTLRWVFIMVLFVGISILLRNLVLAVYIPLVGSVIFDMYLIRVANCNFQMPISKIDMGKMCCLVKQCVALFLVAFLTYYVTNAPKYAIDQYLTEEMQAYYGYISMPVFVVELLNCFLYQPQMVALANDWGEFKFSAFRKKILRQSLIIVGLTIICVIGAYLLGIPVLSILYGVDLKAFRLELVILMLSGGALAFVGYSSVILTIMRKQFVLMINMIIVTVLAIWQFGRVVQGYGILGATVYYLVLMLVLSLLNYCCTIFVENKIKSNLN